MRIVRTLLFLAIVTFPIRAQAQQTADLTAGIDKIFERWKSTGTPGCALAVSRDGKIILSRAYGMADLEHDVVNTPDTIFEAGSVSKQFTAAAIVLLALQGKLSLDDNVRKYVPEVPDYGSPILIRHLMNHTSGLRDWGSVAGIAGWPRTSRVHTHAHVLDILSRQRALNFMPGAEHSYCNSGFNLLAVIVDRVSGLPFAEFTRRNIFVPLGMTHTQWRDDFKRVVSRRAVAYAMRQGSAFEMDMPFENVHGNGGLLTTVGDLLQWTENLESGKVGGPAFLDMMHRQGKLNDGKTITYASGLYVTSYKGIPEVSHTGSTAGYRAFLARYPKQRLAVALLANVGSITPGDAGHRIAELFLQVPPAPAKETAVSVTIPAAEQAARAGLYRNAATGEPLRLVMMEGTLRIQRGGALLALSVAEYRVIETDRILRFEPAPGGRRPRIRETRGGDEAAVYEPVAEFTPKAADLSPYAGGYYSPDAEAALTAVVEGDRLVLRRRPDTRIALTPVYADVFESSLGLVRFLRDSGGRVTQLSVRQDRVYDLRFDREK